MSQSNPTSFSHEARVDRLAAGLRTSGIAGGDLVLARLTDGADLAALIVACRRVGAGLAVLSAGMTGAEVARARATIAPTLEVAADAVPLEALAAMGGDGGPATPLAADAPLVWRGSLGNGNPFVRCTLDQVLAQARAMADRLRLTVSDHVSIRADAAHPMAVIAALAAAMVGAVTSSGSGDAEAVATVVVVPDTKDLGAVIGSFNANHLRLVLTEGAAPSQVHGPTILTAWTMAEVGGLATLCDPADPADTAQSTRGRRMPGVEIMIVDAQTGLDRLLLEPGEVWLRAWPRQGVSVGDCARSDPGNFDGFIRTGWIGMLDPEGRLILEDARAD